MSEHIGDNAKMTLELRDISFSYLEKGKSHLDALGHISLSVLEHEFVCILGPSGCGKSTLLNIIAGFIKPLSGEAKMDGELIEKPGWQRGFVFQNPVLYPWLNVKNNVAFGLKARKFKNPEVEKLTETYLQQVGLLDFAYKKTYELSGGMRQRAAFARVLINQPRIVLLDEPFSALDAFTRVEMQNLTRRIWQESNSAFVMVTHDIDEALSLGTRVVVMSRRPGQIVADFPLNFTHNYDDENFANTKFSDDYLEIRRKIFEIINTEANTIM